MKHLITWASLLVLLVVFLELSAEYKPLGWNPTNPRGIYGTPPLVMRGGDPYIRALMRTISASEANVSRPYSVLYGGTHVWDLSRHPNRCVPIVAGPNIGNCTTAAGRYQFINTTWYDKARRYHPQPWGFWIWQGYSFEPQYQDAVVYAWLSDKQAWDMDISAQLRQGRLNRVLRRLSGTWTSLGYGIENNAMTGYLPGIYQRMLREELPQAESGSLKVGG
ncbi:MAG TPA: glycoside hydrolase [Cyanobacteria bacterium UBA8803]|nr:glycoside hydrolase [Cyanobacteria bacterium UBA9273]HBL61383.1 glycoside hydrolase [Cyanobacteria bacterium UBA8803]